MKTKDRSKILKIISITVTLSLILAACAPGAPLAGAGGADATEPPAVAPTDPPVVATDPPVVATDPPVVATDPPVVATDPPVVATDPPVVASDTPVAVAASNTSAPTATNAVAATNTSTFTPTVTFTPTATSAINNILANTSTPTSTSTVAGRAATKTTSTSTATSTVAPTSTSTSTNTPQAAAAAVAVVDPYLGLGVACNRDLTATFTITNIGGALTGGTYTINEPGKASKSGTLNLSTNQSVSFNAAGNATISVQYSTSVLAQVNLSAVGTCLPLPSNTPSTTPKPTNTPSPTNTPGPSPTPTNTRTPKPTNTPSNTPTPTSTITPGPSPTATGTNTPKPSKTPSNTPTATSTITPGPSPTPTNTQTPRPSKTPSNTPTVTYTPSLTPTIEILDGQLDLQVFCNADLSATFVIRNVSGAVSDGSYNLSDPSQTGSINLQPGQSTSINGVGYATMTVTYRTSFLSSVTLSTVGSCIKQPDTPTPTITATASANSPALTASGVCTSNSGVATFTVTNNGGDMTTPYTYNVKDANGTVVQTATFQLNAGKSTTITVNGSSSSYSLSSPDDQNLSAIADMSACVAAVQVVAPALTASGVCTSNSGVATFVITNNGGDMTTPYTYNVKDSTGNTVQSATFQLTAGSSKTITVSGSSGMYILSSPDDKNVSASADMSTCKVTPATNPVALTASGVCSSASGTATFVITNNGGDMTTPYTYVVKDVNGNVVQTAVFQLIAGASQTITISGTSSSYTLSSPDDAKLSAVADMTACVESDAAAIPNIAPAKAEPCIQCLIFHTFRDKNLEVYRLDGIEGQPGFKLYNLSKSEAVDSRPSRAPNDSEVVFQSNRNGNVELYYTDMLGSGDATRLTNTQSNNTNPMYGPDARTIVYQSDRNGNFDLFTIDQVTRKETQITSDQADEVNPFYSPDLKFLVFQSNRNGNWDLYALNVETGNETQLTNTTFNETFPAWSPNGRQIAFLSDENGGTDLYIYDTQSKTIKRITTDGKTNNAVWSPEGNRIAYQSERNGNLDIYSYDLTTNKEYRVTTYEGPDSGPTWDCGGTNLAFTSTRDNDPNIFQVFWQGGEAGNMTIDPATDKWSQWRPSNDVSSVGY